MRNFVWIPLQLCSVKKIKGKNSEARASSYVTTRLRMEQCRKTIFDARTWLTVPDFMMYYQPVIRPVMRMTTQSN